MDCVHCCDSRCDLATQLAEQPVTPHETACNFCTQKCDPAQSVNRVTVSIAVSSLPPDSVRRKWLLANYGHLLPRTPRPLSEAARLQAILAGDGPGSQLWKLLESLGVHHRVDCSCLSRAERMNAWGVAGCRAARAEIVAWMETGSEEYGWSTVVTAALKAFASGLAWRLSILDPYGSLLDEAIRRAEVVGTLRVPQPTQPTQPV